MSIHYIFGIGRRCNCTELIRNNRLTKIASPTDRVFIDLETSLINLKNHFENYLNDIVMINRAQNRKDLLYLNNRSEIDQRLSEFTNTDICYMSHNYNYNGYTLCINQNYLPSNIVSNIYEWERLCIFIHHNLSEHC